MKSSVLYRQETSTLSCQRRDYLIRRSTHALGPLFVNLHVSVPPLVFVPTVDNFLAKDKKSSHLRKGNFV
jgi:hypothetical protein